MYFGGYFQLAIILAVGGWVSVGRGGYTETLESWQIFLLVERKTGFLADCGRYFIFSTIFNYFYKEILI